MYVLEFVLNDKFKMVNKSYDKIKPLTLQNIKSRKLLNSKNLSEFS